MCVCVCILRISAGYLPQVVAVYENKHTEGAAFCAFRQFSGPGEGGGALSEQGRPFEAALFRQKPCPVYNPLNLFKARAPLK